MKATRAMKAMRLKAAAFAILAFGTMCALAMTGCSGKVSTDETGGISSESSQATNLVNPSQLPDSSFIYDASMADLANADSYMEGQTVQIIGEVVGDRIMSEAIGSDESGKYCWITMQATDGTYAEMAVYMPLSATAVIDTYGAYGRRGTTLQVRGTFNLACKDHDGATDIHSDNVSLVSRGSVEQSHLDLTKFSPGIVLILIAAALFIAYWRLSESRR